MLHSLGSYEGSQILAYRSISIDAGTRACEMIDRGLVPNWLSGPSDPTICDWRWCLPASYGSREFTCIGEIQIRCGHIGQHDGWPGSDRWIASGNCCTMRHGVSYPIK